MSSEQGDEPGVELTEEERNALHEVELGLESLHRAHGHLVSFHHAVGHAMDHLADAEAMLRECEQGELADRLRDDHLPSGVTHSGTWTYDLLEQFQEGFMTEVSDFEELVRESIADGERHVAERRMQHQWADRAERNERGDDP